MTRLSLVERFRIARAAFDLATEKQAREPEPAPPPVEPGPQVERFDRAATMAAAKLRETFPLCSYCGCRKVLCPDCGGFWCSAPGHLRHVCKSPEFSQVGP